MGSEALQAAVKAARSILSEHEDDPDIAPIMSDLHRLADGDQSEEDGAVEKGGEDRLSTALIRCHSTLEKCEAGPARDELAKAAMALEREAVARTNPNAANAWQRTWGRVHGVAA
jgi:hypothetical protein